MSGETRPPEGAVAATFVFDQVRRDEDFEELNDRVLEVGEEADDGG
ncbi:MAG: hypothetical protein ABEJ00_03670 [Gemmatimonadota bacterium]